MNSIDYYKMSPCLQVEMVAIAQSLFSSWCLKNKTMGQAVDLIPCVYIHVH